MTLFTSPVSWPASWPSPQKLLDAAREAQRASYSPYSGFPVGAALFVEGMDDLILACNVENGSYGLSICAERSAAVAMIAEAPARMARLADRGRLEAGLRADLVQVRPVHDIPVVRRVWREGQRVS